MSAGTATQRFGGRTALVTGGGAGMGEACVRGLAAEGAWVWALDRDRDRVARLADELTGLGHQVRALAADVTDEAALEAAFAAVAEQGRLDVLIQVAGGSAAGTLEALPLKEWDRLYAWNLRSTVLGCRLALPRMERGGAIVNMASISGLRGDPGWGAYNAFKAAIINLTQSLAWEVGARGIRVNAVCPGPIASPRMVGSLSGGDDTVTAYGRACALGRLGEPAEAAAAILFLASDDASFVTGHALVVDGGLTARTGQPVEGF